MSDRSYPAQRRCPQALRSALCIIAGLVAALSIPALGQNCSNDHLDIEPLNDLGSGLYLGQYQGGLYRGGANAPPIGHETEGLLRAAAIEPLDALGRPDPEGRYILMSIGMSNTTQEYCGGQSSSNCREWSFMGQAADDPRVNHESLVLIDGAAGGQAADAWESPNSPNYDRIRDQILIPRGLSELQVQVLWIKLANRRPSRSLPDPEADAFVLMRRIGNTLRACKTRYPNLSIVFLSSRIYAGYAEGVSDLNPEPYAYEAAFTMKWLIEAQVTQMESGAIDPNAGDLDYTTVAPWIAWGPYLWADGVRPRSDGLTWLCADFAPDGTHPSASGQEKVGTMLLNFMLTSPFAVDWFRAEPGGNTPPVARITAPAHRSTFQVGQIVQFSGTGVDLEDGPLPRQAFEWRVDIPTRGIFDRLVVVGRKAGSGVVPFEGRYVLRLIVTDSEGLRDTDEVEFRVVP